MISQTRLYNLITFHLMDLHFLVAENAETLNDNKTVTFLANAYKQMAKEPGVFQKVEYYLNKHKEYIISANDIIDEKLNMLIRDAIGIIVVEDYPDFFSISPKEMSNQFEEYYRSHW